MCMAFIVVSLANDLDILLQSSLTILLHSFAI